MGKTQMLKKLLKIGTFIGVLLGSTAINAVPIVDTIDQSVYVGWWDNYSYTHELMDDGFVPDSAVSANLEIQFSYNGGWFNGWETIVIVVEEFDLDSDSLVFSASSYFNELEVNALAQINDSGSLDVTIHSLFGDFYVGQSVLTVETLSAIPGDILVVPEPAVLGLLGLGLLGFVMTRRIQKT